MFKLPMVTEDVMLVLLVKRLLPEMFGILANGEGWFMLPELTAEDAKPDIPTLACEKPDWLPPLPFVCC